MYSGPIINVHTHLRLTDDLDARVANWRKWNLRKVIALSVHPRWRCVGYCVNEDFPPLLKRYPDILVGFGAVNLLAGQVDPPEQIDRLKAQGFAGLKFEDNGFPYNHEVYGPLYARAEALGLPILFHTGQLAGIRTADGVCHDGRDGIDAEAMRPYLLDKVARAFPKLTIIGAHLGLPHPFEAINLMEFHPNVYFDFSGGCGCRNHVRRVIAALQPPLPTARMDDPEENPALRLFQEKLLFATDNPEPDVWVPASETILDALQIPSAARECFYYRTAARLFGWTVA